jgi:hypothetical protein
MTELPSLPRYWTQTPAPLQKLPPPWLQAVPKAAKSWVGLPPLQRPITHWFAGAGMSPGLTTTVTLPAPSQTFDRQSPTTWDGVSVPEGEKDDPQTPALQAKDRQAVLTPQSVAVMQAPAG